MQALCDLYRKLGVASLLKKPIEAVQDIADRSGIVRNILDLSWSVSNALD